MLLIRVILLFMAVSVFFILVSAGLIIATVILRKKAEKGHN